MREWIVARLPAAALAMIRMDELSQSANPLYQQLLRTLLNRQDEDGGWSDPMTTALALKGSMPLPILDRNPATSLPCCIGSRRSGCPSP